MFSLPIFQFQLNWAPYTKSKVSGFWVFFQFVDQQFVVSQIQEPLIQNVKPGKNLVNRLLKKYLLVYENPTEK